VREIPIQVNLFDLVHADGEDYFDEKFSERRRKLETIVKEIPGKFQFARQLVTKDVREAEKFYKEALKAKQEGVMIKNLEALYQPGRRVAGGWLKVKPTMENLDLCIIGGTWGTGKRVGWLGSLLLGCRDKSGKFLPCGMIGTGVKEKEESGGVTFDQLTRLLKPHIIEEKGNEVRVKPKVVVEVSYEEIQKSPNYESGYALRFPRVLRIREDKGPNQADTKERLEYLYKMQFGKK
ncbi:MAG: DNA ligase, partial [Candidatus Aenigmarchaeota archaeon]|nr:DNA ligase [Candidatus Aenigmarchaeota archaeon]